VSHHHAERIDELRDHKPPPLRPTDPLPVVLRAQMHTQFVQLLQTEDACRLDKNVEALRTMRQAAAHLHLMVTLTEAEMGIVTAKKAEKRLRQLGDCLDAVYELDMMMRDILHYGAALAQRMTIASIVAHLDARRLLAKHQLVEFLDSKKYAKFVKRFQQFLLEPIEDFVDEPDPGDPQQTRHRLPALLHEQLATVRAYDPFMESNDSAVFTDLRADLTRFRHILVCFESMLGSSVTAYLKDLNALSELLDRIAELSATVHRLVHLPRLNMDTDQLSALQGYRRDLRTRREKLYQQLPALWQDFNLRRTQENLSQSILVLL
jgi:CHAD domain-containing protein